MKSLGTWRHSDCNRVRWVWRTSSYWTTSRMPTHGHSDSPARRRCRGQGCWTPRCYGYWGRQGRCRNGWITASCKVEWALVICRNMASLQGYQVIEIHVGEIKFNWTNFAKSPLPIGLFWAVQSCLDKDLLSLLESFILSLTHWDWVTHICVNKLTIFGSDDGLSSGRHQAIILTRVGASTQILSTSTSTSTLLSMSTSTSTEKMCEYEYEYFSLSTSTSTAYPKY